MMSVPTENKVTLIELALQQGWTCCYYAPAKAWILRGDPMRFGIITIRDLFPTTAMVESVEWDWNHYVTWQRNKSWREGYECGLAVGRNEGIREGREAEIESANRRVREFQDEMRRAEDDIQREQRRLAMYDSFAKSGGCHD